MTAQIFIKIIIGIACFGGVFFTQQTIQHWKSPISSATGGFAFISFGLGGLLLWTLMQTTF